MRPRPGGFHLGLLALFAAALTACEPEIQVEVVSLSLPQPAFRLSMSGEDQARFTEGEVRAPDGTVAWAFRATVPGVRSGATEIVYGQPPTGFETVEGPAALVSGLEYTLGLEGKGRGLKAFTPVEP